MTQWIKKLCRRYRRLIVYGFVGVTNTLVDYGVFYLLYNPIGVNIELSQVAGFLSGTVVSYILNSNVTFREGKGRTKGQFLQCIGLDIVFALLSGWFMGWAEAWRCPVLVTKTVATVAVALMHYVIYKYFVFRIRKDEN